MPDSAGISTDHRSASIFLSYARADQACARKLCAALTQAGFDVWWDALIEGGEQFDSSITGALDRADVVLVLWSHTSVQSPWVRDEAAVGRDRARLVPLSVDGTEPPLGFRQYHAIALDRWHGRADAPEVAAIVRAAAALSVASSAEPASASHPLQRGATRRHVVAGAIGAGAVAAGAGGLWWAGRHGLPGGGDESPNGVAVLPFRTLGADPAQAYFSAGLTEEVRAALRRVAPLKVSAATSCDAAAETRDDVPTIARKLGVAFVLEGSVQRAADTVRIALNLSDGATGFSRWSKTVDRPMADIFATQREIAGMVADAMSVHLVTTAPPVGGTTDVGAYEHFLHGRALFNLAKDEPTDRAALSELNMAIALDPGFALAHAARSRSIAAIAGEYADAAQLPALYDEAIAAAQRALGLAPDLAEASLAMGFALFTGRLAIGAARPFYDRAFALAAGNADIVLLFALYCSRAARPREAQAAIGRALALDPLNPRTFRAAGSIAYAARRYRDALMPLRRALALNAALSNTHSLIGLCLLQLGDGASAAREFAAEPHAIFRLAGLAIVSHRAGDEAGARLAYDRMVRDLGDSALYQRAEVLAQRGDTAGALTTLEHARAVGDSGLIYLATDPLLDPIRREPRFATIARTMGLR